MWLIMKAIENLLKELRDFGNVSNAKVLNAHERALPDKIYNASKTRRLNDNLCADD